MLMQGLVEKVDPATRVVAGRGRHGSLLRTLGQEPEMQQLAGRLAQRMYGLL